MCSKAERARLWLAEVTAGILMVSQDPMQNWNKASLLSVVFCCLIVAQHPDLPSQSCSCLPVTRSWGLAVGL